MIVSNVKMSNTADRFHGLTLNVNLFRGFGAISRMMLKTTGAVSLLIAALGATPAAADDKAAAGGLFVAASVNDGAAGSAASAEAADTQFRTLFQTWKKLDLSDHTVISVPSMQPVDKLVYSSSFGVRSDPFRRTAAMHAGVDIPGAIGTPIFATADGVVSFSGRRGAYGNLVQINHGRGIETRYAHMSKILVADNARVRRGQMIGLMGSTGRSTGSHLHYEVRLDGAAVNPIPFLQNGEYVAQVEPNTEVAVGGPAN